MHAQAHTLVFELLQIAVLDAYLVFGLIFTRLGVTSNARFPFHVVLLDELVEVTNRPMSCLVAGVQILAL